MIGYNSIIHQNFNFNTLFNNYHSNTLSIFHYLLFTGHYALSPDQDLSCFYDFYDGSH